MKGVLNEHSSLLFILATHSGNQGLLFSVLKKSFLAGPYGKVPYWMPRIEPGLVLDWPSSRQILYPPCYCFSIIDCLN